MLLTLDIGNSNISVGVFAGEALKMRAKLSATAERSSDECAAMLFNLLQINHVDPAAVDGCMLASVVPGLTSLVEEAVGRLFRVPLLRVGPGIKTGFRISIDDPSQLGADLVADTAAALAEYGAPLVLVDAGTVTTIAAVDDRSTYLGGCILPGIRASAELLKETTALLPSIALRPGGEECLGRNSADAMRCGLLLGSGMMVDGFIQRYQALPRMEGAKVISTGGSARLVTAQCRSRIHYDPDLTLKGLRHLYQLNTIKKL